MIPDKEGSSMHSILLRKSTKSSSVISIAKEDNIPASNESLIKTNNEYQEKFPKGPLKRRDSVSDMGYFTKSGTEPDRVAGEISNLMDYLMNRIFTLSNKKNLEMKANSKIPIFDFTLSKEDLNFTDFLDDIASFINYAFYKDEKAFYEKKLNLYEIAVFCCRLPNSSNYLFKVRLKTPWKEIYMYKITTNYSLPSYVANYMKEEPTKKLKIGFLKKVMSDMREYSVTSEQKFIISSLPEIASSQKENANLEVEDVYRIFYDISSEGECKYYIFNLLASFTGGSHKYTQLPSDSPLVKALKDELKDPDLKGLQENKVKDFTLKLSKVCIDNKEQKEMYDSISPITPDYSLLMLGITLAIMKSLSQEVPFIVRISPDAYLLYYEGALLVVPVKLDKAADYKVKKIQVIKIEDEGFDKEPALPNSLYMQPTEEGELYHLTLLNSSNEIVNFPLDPRKSESGKESSVAQKLFDKIKSSAATNIKYSLLELSLAFNFKKDELENPSDAFNFNNDKLMNFFDKEFKVERAEFADALNQYFKMLQAKPELEMNLNKMPSHITSEERFDLLFKKSILVLFYSLFTIAEKLMEPTSTVAPVFEQLYKDSLIDFKKNFPEAFPYFSSYFTNLYFENTFRQNVNINPSNYSLVIALILKKIIDNIRFEVIDMPKKVTFAEEEFKKDESPKKKSLTSSIISPITKEFENYPNVFRGVIGKLKDFSTDPNSKVRYSTEIECLLEYIMSSYFKHKAPKFKVHQLNNEIGKSYFEVVKAYAEKSLSKSSVDSLFNKVVPLNLVEFDYNTYKEFNNLDSTYKDTYDKFILNLLGGAGFMKNGKPVKRGSLTKENYSQMISFVENYPKDSSTFSILKEFIVEYKKNRDRLIVVFDIQNPNRKKKHFPVIFILDNTREYHFFVNTSSNEAPTDISSTLDKMCNLGKLKINPKQGEEGEINIFTNKPEFKMRLESGSTIKFRKVKFK